MTPTIYIVTPSFNAAETIDRTILSVISQAGDFRLRYHVQDGGSTDDTVARLEWWQEQLRGGQLAQFCHGIRLTWQSEPDSGMYDAVVKGFGGLNAASNDFLTWINADDILMPGALALAATVYRQFKPNEVSWFGGSVCTLRDDMNLITYDRPVPRFALREGLCDGVHWDFVQQEGTFFRKWLWQKIDPYRTIAPLKLAGDWNLWRNMAANAEFSQIATPTGAFRLRPGQLSAKQRDKYLSEINEILPVSARREALDHEAAKGPALRRYIKASTISQLKDDEKTRLFIRTASIDSLVAHRYRTVFSTPAPWVGRKTPEDSLLYEGAVISGESGVTNILAPLVVETSPGVVAGNSDWQFPAITEKHAYERIRQSGLRPPKDVIYVAYPWATLIDKVQNKASDANQHLSRFSRFCTSLPPHGKKITVCQHIYGRRYIDFFRQAGISDVFWSHATHDDADGGVGHGIEDDGDVRFHPFPLYPVQVPAALPEAGPEADGLARPYLFSFIGARANQYYITEARNWILDLLKDDPRGLILGRDGWHYHKIVYDLQIRGSAAAAEAPALVDGSASDQFRASLLQSTFSLCPAGSGPNSIRLWESLGAGSIPVILADTWAPPGDPRLWEMAAVFCKETPEDIKALPDRLAVLAADPARLVQMRHAMRQLWLLYGPHSFVTDIQLFLLGQTESSPPEAVEDSVQVSDPALTGAEDPEWVLMHSARLLLLEPAQTLNRIEHDPVFAGPIARACAGLAEDSAALRHYRRVLDHARQASGTTRAPDRLPAPAAPHLTAPVALQQVVPKVCLLGRHAHRTPLGYAPIRKLVGDRIAIVETADQADLIVTGFNIDLTETADTLLPLLQRPRPPKMVILSEEPLWDITWSGAFTGRAGSVRVKETAIPYTFLGHETSQIYNFQQIPYFVLTSDTYPVRYASLMARFAQLSPADLLQKWAQASVPAAFVAEHRKGDGYKQSFPARKVFALSDYRTQVAERTTATGAIRAGKGWGEAPRRQDLFDWHLDKLALLDGRTRVLSAYENVHQRFYISEKIFDAFAIGAIPAYWAGPDHRIFDLVPGSAMINTFDCTPEAAAERLKTFEPDAGFAADWLATAASLARLFSDFPAIRAERRRVADAVVQDLAALC